MGEFLIYSPIRPKIALYGGLPRTILRTIRER